MQLICCILVVYIHCNVTSEFPTVCGFNTNWIQYFIRHILGSLAVPTFFCISGYLFFQGIETMKDVKEKMKKRAKTLIIPYLIGCFICFIITLFSQEEPIEFLQSKSVAKQLFYIFFPGYNFPLWYVRNLILIVLISPLLFYVRQLGFLVVLGIQRLYYPQYTSLMLFADSSLQASIGLCWEPTSFGNHSINTSLLHSLPT